MERSTGPLTLLSVIVFSCISQVTVANETGKMMTTATSGIGYDSNAFLSPGSPYTDYYIDYLNIVNATAVNTAITPQIQSGMFADLGLESRYFIDDTKDGLYIDYEFDGELYLDGNLSNASEYKHGFRLGRTVNTGRKSGLDIAATMDIDRNTYFDRDSGDIKHTTIKQSDISKRYNYTSMGAEAEWRKRTGRHDYRLIGEIESRTYTATPIAELDHTRMEIGGKAGFKTGKRNRFRIGYNLNNYHFSVRKALSTADALPSAVLRAYNDHRVDLSLMLRQGRSIRYYLDYNLKYRRDSFEGYHDYDQNRLKLRVLHNGRNLDSKLSFSRLDRSYAHAFAFDNPSQPGKTYGSSKISLEFSHIKMAGREWWMDMSYKQTDSNDLRYVYDRFMLKIGTDWDL